MAQRGRFCSRPRRRWRSVLTLHTLPPEASHLPRSKRQRARASAASAHPLHQWRDAPLVRAAQSVRNTVRHRHQGPKAKRPICCGQFAQLCQQARDTGQSGSHSLSPLLQDSVLSPAAAVISPGAHPLLLWWPHVQLSGCTHTPVGVPRSVKLGL